MPHKHYRYRTRLCYNYHELGVCNYGSRCSFIHGEGLEQRGSYGVAGSYGVHCPKGQEIPLTCGTVNNRTVGCQSLDLLDNGYVGTSNLVFGQEILYTVDNGTVGSQSFDVLDGQGIPHTLTYGTAVTCETLINGTVASQGTGDNGTMGSQNLDFGPAGITFTVNNGNVGVQSFDVVGGQAIPHTLTCETVLTSGTVDNGIVGQQSLDFGQVGLTYTVDSRNLGSKGLDVVDGRGILHPLTCGRVDSGNMQGRQSLDLVPSGDNGSVGAESLDFGPVLWEVYDVSVQWGVYIVQEGYMENGQGGAFSMI